MTKKTSWSVYEQTRNQPINQSINQRREHAIRQSIKWSIKSINQGVTYSMKWRGWFDGPHFHALARRHGHVITADTGRGIADGGWGLAVPAALPLHGQQRFRHVQVRAAETRIGRPGRVIAHRLRSHDDLWHDWSIKWRLLCAKKNKDKIMMKQLRVLYGRLLTLREREMCFAVIRCGEFQF